MLGATHRFSSFFVQNKCGHLNQQSVICFTLQVSAAEVYLKQKQLSSRYKLYGFTLTKLYWTRFEFMTIFFIIVSIITILDFNHISIAKFEPSWLK